MPRGRGSAWGCLGPCPGTGALPRGVSRPRPRGCPGPGQGGPGPGPGGVCVCIPACTEADSPPPDSYCCRWYTSYWNAFLFHKHVSRILSTGGSATNPPGQTHPSLGRQPPGRHPTCQAPPGQSILGYSQHAGGMHPTGMQCCVFTGVHKGESWSLGDPPGQRTPLTENPQTENPWTETPWTKTLLDRDPLWTETPWTDTPLGQRPPPDRLPWTETPWTETPRTETPTQ